MNRKGFTLIELLAVIVILGIILTFAVPSITNIYKESNLDLANKYGKYFRYENRNNREKQ